MKLLKSTNFIFFLCFIMLLSCNKENISSSNNFTNSDEQLEIFSEKLGQDISRDFLGKIIDQNKNPIESARISIGDNNTFTDSNGVFIIREATIKEKLAFIKVQKDGFIDGSRSLVPSQGTNKVEIMLLPETVTTIISSGNEATVALPNGANIKLKGDYINSEGETYNGNVSVILHHLNPSDEDMSLQMPGMLYAANAQNEARLLKTFGMLTVELKGENGEDLNIAENSNAEISMPVDSSILGTAPSDIPLWYFNENYGIWVEEGNATLVGNAYVGTVNHFSTWNCDVPFETVNLCITINDNSGNNMSTTENPLANLKVVLSAPGYGSMSGFTNEIGELCLPIPENIEISLEISYNGSCTSDIIYSENIGSFSDDNEIEIDINSIPEQVYLTENITGTFVTCDGVPVTNGYVELNYDGEIYTDIVSDGNFEINLIRCAEDGFFTFSGVDFNENETVGPISFQFFNETNNIGTIPTCSSIEEFVRIDVGPNIVINEDIQIALEVFADLISSCSFITEIDNEGNLNISWVPCQNSGFPTFNLFACRFTEPGTYPIDFTGDSCFFGGSQISQIQFRVEYEASILAFDFISGSLNITFYGEIGEYIDFNITGQAGFNLAALQDVTITGHILRDD